MATSPSLPKKVKQRAISVWVGYSCDVTIKWLISIGAMKKNDGSLTYAQLQAELNRCEYCEEKPCKEACPADCSPADFIMAARVGEKSDLRRSAAMIMGSNPLGWVRSEG